MEANATVTANRTVYAKWAKYNKITYELGYTTEDEPPVQGDVRTGYAFNLPEAPFRTGHNFVGWVIGEDVYLAGTTYNITGEGDIVFTAQWTEARYTVSFYDMNGELIDEQSIVYEQAATPPEFDPAQYPEKEHYTVGWTVHTDRITADMRVDLGYILVPTSEDYLTYIPVYGEDGETVTSYQVHAKVDPETGETVTMPDLLVVPVEYNKLPVVIQPVTRSNNEYIGIGFMGTGVKKVFFGDRMKTVSDYAFFNCADLTEVTYDDETSIESLGAYAYAGTKLTVAQIPSNVSVIPEGLFEDVTTLTEIQFADSDNLETIGAYAFAVSGDTKLITEVTIPASVKTIGTGAFYYRVGIKTLTFAEGSVLETIGASAFEGPQSGGASKYSSLTKVEFPSTLKTIGNRAFRCAVKLGSITFNEGLESIGDQAFFLYSASSTDTVTKLSIPSTVTHLGSQVFQNMGTLGEVTFAENSSLEYIPYYMFYGCKVLKTINNFPLVKSIRGGAFQNTAFTTFTLPYTVEIIGEPVTDSEGKVVSSGKSAFAGITSLEEFIFQPAPEGVESADLVIGDEAFNGSFKPKDTDSNPISASITIPARTVSIGAKAFYQCENLIYSFEAASASAKPLVIGDNAFAGGTGTTATGFKAASTSDKNLKLPARVTTIGNNAFYGNYLKSIDFEENSQCTSIGDYAFAYSYAIGSNTTADKINPLESITLPYGLINIGKFAFAGHTSANLVNAKVTSITIPASVTTIGEKAFYCYKGIGQITFESVSGDSVDLTVGANAFSTTSSYSNTNTFTVELPSRLVSLGANAFSYLKNANFTLPNPFRIANIGDGVFSNTGFAGALVLPEGMTEIGTVFAGTAITELVIPGTITKIADGAFKNCVELTSVTFAPGTAELTIGKDAFAGTYSTSNTNCNVSKTTKLTSLELPARTKSIGVGIVTGTNVSALSVNADCADFSSEGNIIYNKDKTVAITAAPKLSGNLTLPASVKEIAAQAFAFTGITSITADSVTDLGDNAFAGCPELTTASVTGLENKLDEEGAPTEMGKGAFMYCAKLTTVDLGNKLQYLAAYMFKNCTALESINVPASVTHLGGNIFNASGIKTLDLSENNFKYFAPSAFAAVKNITSITFKDTVEADTIPASMFNQSTALTGLVIPEGIKYIKGGAFYGCSNLESVELPSSLLQMYKSFEGTTTAPMENLKKVTIKSGEVTLIASTSGIISEFIGCKNLSEIIFNDEATLKYYMTQPDWQIYADRFTVAGYTEEESTDGNFNITTRSLAGEAKQKILKSYTGSEAQVTVPYGITAIGIGAFKGKTDITSVTLPDTVVYIASGAFEGCTSLTTVNTVNETNEAVDSNVKVIGDYAFNGCKALTNDSVKFPNLETLRSYAMAGCTALTEFTFNGKLGYIGSYAFSGAANCKTYYLMGSKTRTYSKYGTSAQGAVSVTGTTSGGGIMAEGSTFLSATKDITIWVENYDPLFSLYKNTPNWSTNYAKDTIMYALS